MDAADKVEIERIGTSLRVLIYGANQERYEEAKERGIFVLENILGLFPAGVFKQYPELETAYQKIALKKGV